MTSEQLRLATEAADRKDWATAADLLADARRTDEVLDRRGWYLSRAKRYNEAIEVFTELRQRRQNDYRPPYMIGYQLYEQDRWAESIPHFEDALALRPDHIKSMWRRTYALYKLGREKEAVRGAGRILQVWHGLSPNRQDEDRRLLAKASRLLGRHQLTTDPHGAVELLTQAAANEPDEPYNHYLLAKALRRAGRGKEALEPASTARRLKPGDVNIELEYADALAADGRADEAARVLPKVRNRCSGWIAYRAGALSLRTGNARLAVELLQRAMRDRQTRQEGRVQEALAQAISLAENEAASQPGPDNTSPTTVIHRHRSTPSSSPRSGSDQLGTIDMVRPDRGFGFLVGDDGVRRYFRLPKQSQLAARQQVAFVPIDADKGPAARHVRAI